jgi:hypothetical protein
MGLYYPNVISPVSEEAVDPASSLIFRYQIQGSSSCIAYQLFIINLANGAIYTGTKTSISPLYNNELLEITLSAGASNMVAGTSYKHYVYAFYDATNYMKSTETLIYARTTPTLSLTVPSSPYNQQNYTFTFTYAQAQGVAIKEYTYTLKDSNNNILNTTTVIGSAKTDWACDGFLSGQTYSVDLQVTNQNDVIITDSDSFTVTYSASAETGTVTAVNEESTNSILLSWEITNSNDYTLWRIYRRLSTDTINTLVCTVNINITSIRDYVVRDNSSYIYSVCPATTSIIASGIESNTVTTSFMNYSITDIVNYTEDKTIWRFYLESTQGTVTNNEFVTFVTGYSKYPVALRSIPRYRSGQITSYIGNINSSTGGYDYDTADLISDLLDCLSNGKQKLLKTKKGEIFLIQTHTSTYNTNDQVTQLPSQIVFSWTEVGNLSGITLYDEITS